MLHVRNLARSWGLQSHIFAERGDPRISKTDWLAFDEHHNYSSPQSLLLYHPHNSNSAVAHYFRSVPDRKILYYHNITPAKFFAPWSPQLAADCEAARNEAVALSGAAQATISDSEYNSSELAAAGFERRSVLPLPFFKEQFESSEPDAELGARLRDGATNLLFVGRIAPNKCQHELVEFFDYYRKRVNANARLVIVGTQDTASGYFQKIVENIQTNRIDNAILVGHVTFPQLVSIYRTASAFVCFSEHEGFCVPLLESMYFDVPIIAYDSSAVGETMGTAGIKLRSKDFSAVSAAVERLRNDAPFRSAVIQGQRERLEFFSENNFEERLGRIVAANLTMQ